MNFFLPCEIIRKPMISDDSRGNRKQFAQIPLVLEAKFRKDP